MATEARITVRRGETLIQPWAMSPVRSIAGQTIKLLVRKSRRASSTVFIEAALEVTNVGAGTGTFTVPASALDIEPRVYYYAIRRTSAPQRVLTRGEFRVLAD